MPRATVGPKCVPRREPVCVVSSNVVGQTHGAALIHRLHYGAGLIAGAALVGIANAVVSAFTKQLF